MIKYKFLYWDDDDYDEDDSRPVGPTTYSESLEDDE